MGWASGSRVFSEIIAVIKDEVKSVDKRMLIYDKLIEVFEDADCDTLDECYGEDEAFDELWDQRYPPEEDE